MGLNRETAAGKTEEGGGIDALGSPVGVVRMDPAKAYAGIPGFLKSFIDEANAEAWEKIKDGIDYIHASLDHALDPLDRQTGFGERVKFLVGEGKKLLLKPNIVGPTCIDAVTHGEGRGNIACTTWPFVAALMRWLHDRLDIPYHQMTLGEAGTAVTGIAELYTKAYGRGRRITTEAVLEGRSGDFYGGWGFYFARKYLAEGHRPGHQDDPMNGYEESVAGEYIPPGRAGNRLLVYDLNRVCDLRSKWREIVVPDGACFQRVTLHKAVAGGDPDDPEDRRDYPGCVLINIPKLKVHNRSLFTAAIKNLGIGLYPMEATEDEDPQSTRWKYSFPLDPTPRLKYKVPHFVWWPEIDEQTGAPLTDEKGEYVVAKTAGLSGSMIDMVKAVQNEGIFMLHVVDAIEAINVAHDNFAFAEKAREGYAFASLDPVTLDLLCARYMFKTVPMEEARKLQAEGKVPAEFVQRVPRPEVDKQDIVDGEGFDAPLSRYNLFQYAEARGLGRQEYYVMGLDTLSGQSLASVHGHLGRIEGKAFAELITSTLYYDIFKLLWDLQTTVVSYVKASDSLTGSSYLRELLQAFDENGDGILDFDETGKRRFGEVVMGLIASPGGAERADRFGPYRRAFDAAVRHVRFGNEKWNPRGLDSTREFRLASACATAFQMSRAGTETPDPLFPSITWGNGKWPSLQYALLTTNARAIFGAEFPHQVSLLSPYGQAFQYADKTLQDGKYTGSRDPQSHPEALTRYFAALTNGAAPLDFLLYVPKGYGQIGGNRLPNVEETEDPARTFAVVFGRGQETW